MTLRQLDPKRVPAAILDLLRRLHQAGHRAYLVGGCVRDLLRGVPVSDWDIATIARCTRSSRAAAHASPSPPENADGARRSALPSEGPADSATTTTTSTRLFG